MCCSVGDEKKNHYQLILTTKRWQLIEWWSSTNMTDKTTKELMIIKHRYKTRYQGIKSWRQNHYIRLHQENEISHHFSTKQKLLTASTAQDKWIFSIYIMNFKRRIELFNHSFYFCQISLKQSKTARIPEFFQRHWPMFRKAKYLQVICLEVVPCVYDLFW